MKLFSFYVLLLSYEYLHTVMSCQAALARLEALESDNAGVEVVHLNDDEYGSTDEEDPGLVSILHLRSACYSLQLVNLVLLASGCP